MVIWWDSFGDAQQFVACSVEGLVFSHENFADAAAAC